MIFLILEWNSKIFHDFRDLFVELIDFNCFCDSHMKFNDFRSFF